jgi:hypothetical protein
LTTTLASSGQLFRAPRSRTTQPRFECAYLNCKDGRLARYYRYRLFRHASAGLRDPSPPPQRRSKHIGRQIRRVWQSTRPQNAGLSRPRDVLAYASRCAARARGHAGQAGGLYVDRNAYDTGRPRNTDCRTHRGCTVAAPALAVLLCQAASSGHDAARTTHAIRRVPRSLQRHTYGRHRIESAGQMR